MKEVCVIGAGEAGITIASLLAKDKGGLKITSNLLRKRLFLFCSRHEEDLSIFDPVKDLKVTVLESRSRINGRLDSIDLSSELKVNLGANWIMGERNPLIEYFEFGNVGLQKITLLR